MSAIMAAAGTLAAAKLNPSASQGIPRRSSVSASCALPSLPNRACGKRRLIAVKAAAETEAEVEVPITGPETGLKRTAALEETYAVLDSGKWGCNSCGYVYNEAVGDPNYPIAAGMEFKKLPEDWTCPTCGAAPGTFKSMGREVAGFAQNQGYGLGTNSMTGSQKGLLIWGSLAFFFALFMSGYFLE